MILPASSEAASSPAVLEAVPLLEITRPSALFAEAVAAASSAGSKIPRGLASSTSIPLCNSLLSLLESMALAEAPDSCIEKAFDDGTNGCAAARN